MVHLWAIGQQMTVARWDYLVVVDLFVYSLCSRKSHLRIGGYLAII